MAGLTPENSPSKRTGLKPIEQLVKLTDEELCTYIRGPILDAENRLYTKERNTGLHKLVFLVGGPQKDISRVRDSHGRSVHITPPEFARAPEIIEGVVTASDVLSGKEKDTTKFYSEATDITHNLTLLTTLDPEAELYYKQEIKTYKDCVLGLATSLNLNVRDLLLLSAIKYTKRLGSSIKDIPGENKLIKEAIDNLITPLSSLPTMRIISNAYGAINMIECMLLPRLNYLAEIEGWELSTTKKSDNIFR